MEIFMNTELLRAFVTVAECEGFSTASKTLNRTQSAVSLQIKRLEDQLAISLFQRTSRSVTLTSSGERFMPYARSILKLEDEARLLMGDDPEGNLIRFGTSEEQASTYLPLLLPDFAHRYPKVRLEVVCGISSDLVRDFQNGLLDAVLVIRHKPTQSGVLIGRESLIWVIADHLSPEQWNILPLALNPEGCVFRAHAIAALGRQHRRWDVRYSSQSPIGSNLPVQAGLALTVKTPRSVPEGCRIVGENEGLPPLGSVEVEMHRAPGHNHYATVEFCDTLEKIVTKNELVKPTNVVSGSPRS
jgi:DNA-binding transcriptional LysR family regulator